MRNLASRLSLKHLRLVTSIAETRQLSLAADALAITQPAASRSLAELEKIVGRPLFDRHPKGMEPTPAGEILIRNAKICLGQMSAATAELEALEGGLAGTVRVGAVTGPAVRFVVPALQKLKTEAQRTEVSVNVAPSSELVDGLLRGDYDMVLARVPPYIDARRLDVRRGRVEVVRYLTRADHPLQSRQRVTYIDLANLTWIIQARGMPIREGVEQAFINRGLPVPKDSVDTASLLVALSYLRESDAVAAMTEEVAELVARTGNGEIKELPFKETLILTPYQLIMRKGVPLSPICSRFRDLLITELSPRG